MTIQCTDQQYYTIQNQTPTQAINPQSTKSKTKIQYKTFTITETNVYTNQTPNPNFSGQPTQATNPHHTNTKNHNYY